MRQSALICPVSRSLSVCASLSLLTARLHEKRIAFYCTASVRLKLHAQFKETKLLDLNQTVGLQIVVLGHKYYAQVFCCVVHNFVEHFFIRSTECIADPDYSKILFWPALLMVFTRREELYLLGRFNSDLKSLP